VTESASPDGFVHAPVVMLRGSRNYVHSTDLYCELMAGAKAAGLAMIDGIVTLDIRSPITTQPEFHFGESGPIGGAVAANFELGVGGRVSLAGSFAAIGQSSIESLTTRREFGVMRASTDRVSKLPRTPE